MTDKQHSNDAVPSFVGPRTISGALAFIFILSFAIFIPVLSNGFLYFWDDSEYIIHNEHIRELSTETARWAFFEFYASNWHPLTWLSLALDYELWGLNPAGFHLTNIVIHSINAGLFFLLSLALLKSYLNAIHPDGKKSTYFTMHSAIYCSLLAATFFAIHPLRVESVAWVSERKDVLSLFFGLPAVFYYLKHAQHPYDGSGFRDSALSFIASRYYWVSVAFFCLSLLSKAMFVTLPLMLLVLDWFPLKRLDRPVIIRRLIEKVPFLLLSGMVVVLTISAQASAIMPIEDASLLSRIQIACKSIVTYLWKTAWPINLSTFYLYPGNITGLRLEYIIPLLSVIAITACCVLLRKRHPALMSAWLIYLAALLPVIGLVPIGTVEMADRYTYLPGLAVSLVMALGITAAIARCSGLRSAVMFITTVTLFMLLADAYLTVRQISFWKDDVAFWSRAIDVKPHFSGRTYYQRGISYAAQGDYHKALEDLGEALAIATRKKNRDAMFTNLAARARILQQLGDLNGAIASYTLAISSDSTLSKSTCYLERGALYREIGRADLANEDFRMVNGGK